VISLHRFGASGNFGPEEVAYYAESWNPDGVSIIRCGDCNAIITGLTVDAAGPPFGVSVIHSPGCPWLTQAVREQRAREEWPL